MTSKIRVLVTGATGFVGSCLVKRLKERKDLIIRSMSRTGGEEDPDIEFFNADLSETAKLEQAVRGVDVVYHLAGMLGKWGVPKETYYRINGQGTEDLLQACLRERLKQFIYLSSAGVLGPNIRNADESFPRNPSNVYEQTKAEAEVRVLEYHRRNGLPVTIIRPEFLYGPKDKHVLGLFQALKRRRFFLINQGESLLHPTYIDDLIEVLCRVLLDPAVNGRIYLVAGERSVSVREFTGMISHCLRSAPCELSVPASVALILAVASETVGRGTGIIPILTQSRVKFFSESRSYNTLLARRELGFRPLSLEQGIRKTIQWYEEQGYL